MSDWNGKFLKRFNFYKEVSEPLVLQILSYYNSLPASSREKQCGAVHFRLRKKGQFNITEVAKCKINHLDKIRYTSFGDGKQLILERDNTKGMHEARASHLTIEKVMETM
jgi:hypothetical protein